MATAEQPDDRPPVDAPPWSMQEPLVRRLVASGLKLPTVSAPLNFPVPPESDGSGPSLTELLIADRQKGK